jgi:carbon-monoxide dehydrogenase medium subunit
MDPAAELMGMAALHDATIRLRGKDGDRLVKIADYSVDYLTPDIAPGELLIDVEWKLWPRGHGSCFLEFAYRHGDFAVAGVGALIELNEEHRSIRRAAISLIGVDQRPIRLREAEASLVGASLNDDSWAAAAETTNVIKPLEDAVASSDYRKRLVRVLVQRALQTAAHRALSQHIG